MPRIRVDRAFLVTVVVAFLAPGASSQIIDAPIQEVIETARTAKTEADLFVVADRFRSLAGTPDLWRAAVDRAKKAHGPWARVDQINLLRLALVLDLGLTELPSSDEQPAALDLLQPIEWEALRTETNFPEANDLLLYLLARKPSLKDHFSTDAEYIVTRVTSFNSNRIIIEWASKPYMDLAPVLSEREIAPDRDLVKPPPSGEFALTRRFFLSALPEIVVAAKAARIASLAPVSRRAYAAAVASYALRRAHAWENERIAFVVLGIIHKAIEYAEQSSSDPYLTGLAKDLRRDVPMAAFFARRFVTAAKHYQEAGNTPDAVPKLRLWAAWGEAISRFAAGEVAAARDGFGRMAALLDQGDWKDAYVLGAFLDVLPETERDTLRDTAQWHVAASERFAVVPDPRQTVTIDNNFSQIMETIGRTDLGLAHTLRRLEAVQALPRTDRDRLKPIYLHQVMAFARALSADISFMFTPNGGWEPRRVAGYPKELDFLHHLRSDGQLASAGEVVLLKDKPYGMQNPEEDRATILNAYGLKIAQGPSLTDLVRDWLLNHSIYGPMARQSLTSLTAPNSHIETTRGIARWVIDARDRTEPAPSIVPYLKLVWVEWFAWAFESRFKAPATWLANFRYLPSEPSGLTRPEQIAALKNHPAATSQQKVLIDRFLTLRAFFESRFP